MERNDSLQPVIEQLEGLFAVMNTHFYHGELEKPVITVSPDTTKGAYGWCTSWRAWSDKDDEKDDAGYYEINLCAEWLSRPFEETAGTLLHEMAHLYNLMQGVKDTSRGGFYHNKEFKKAAESHGLTVEKTPKYGYSQTALTPDALKFLTSFNTRFLLHRKAAPTRAKKAAQSSRKYICPLCEMTVRATKEVNIMCGDCGETMIPV